MRGLRHFFSRWQNWLGFLLVLCFVVTAIAAPVISPMDPKDPGVFKRVGHTRSERLDTEPHPPSDVAPLGTLPYQYDVFHTLIWGTRDALSFGLAVVLISGIFGVVFGAVAGYAGGLTNTVMMRVADAFLAFPVIAGVVFLQQLVAIAIEAAGGIYSFGTRYPQFFGSGRIIDIVGEASPIQILLSIINPLMLSLILFSWMPYARLVNSMVIALKRAEFVQAARALGASSFRTVFRHLIPNSVAPSVVLMARDVGGVVILQATLTFIQLGGDSPWGDMLSQGRNWILSASGMFRFWWVYVPATVTVMLFGIAWNLLGDGLNDLLDPAAHYEFQGQPFWRRAFQKREKQTSPVEEAAGVSTGTRPSVSEPVAAPTPRSQTPAPEAMDRLLLAARSDVERGDLSRALHAYRHLIRHDRLIQETIPDLARLIKRYPDDPQVWETLGDALTRSGDADHAAQSYAQAQKLMH
jgi:peptide/nickel transport system permease protein